MGSNIIELAKLGHERAAELKASCGAVDVRSLAQLISDLATQLEVQLVRGNEQAVQLANAESKRRELAAENAWLNIFIEDECFVYSSDTPEPIDANDCKPETPATDAFLAEVRAQGLERLAKAWYAIANETASGISISESSRLKYRQRADDVADFANEIRKEAAEKRVDELSASHSKLRDTIAAIHNTIRMDGGYTPLAAILNAAKRAYEESASAAGIGVKGE
ncbi:TPA: hypothetical protein ACSW47_002508 [Escherichia coli]